MSQENVEKVRAAMEAWNRGDWDAALKDAAPDFELDNSSHVGEWRGVHRGHDAARRLWQRFFDPWESVRFEIEEVIEVNEHVVTRQTTYFVGRDGIEVKARTAGCWTFRDGEATRLLMSNEFAEAMQAAGRRE